MATLRRHRRGRTERRRTGGAVGLALAAAALAGCVSDGGEDGTEPLPPARFLLSEGALGGAELIDVRPGDGPVRYPVLYAAIDEDGTVEHTIRIWTRVGRLAGDVERRDLPSERGEMVLARVSAEDGWYVHADLDGCPSTALIVDPPVTEDELVALAGLLRCTSERGAEFDVASLRTVPEGYREVISAGQATQPFGMVSLDYRVGSSTVTIELRPAPSAFAALATEPAERFRLSERSALVRYEVEATVPETGAMAVTGVGTWSHGWLLSVSLRDGDPELSVATQVIDATQRVADEEWTAATEAVRPAGFIVDEVPRGWRADASAWDRVVTLAPADGSDGSVWLRSAGVDTDERRQLTTTPQVFFDIEMAGGDQPSHWVELQWLDGERVMTMRATVPVGMDVDALTGIARSTRIVDAGAWKDWAARQG